MKLYTTHFVFTVCLIAAICTAPDVRADQPGELSPEQQVLNRLVGEWSYTVTSFKSEWTPAETEASGTYSSQWTLGNNFVNENAKRSDESTHLAMHTYDVQRKVYRRWYFNSNGVALETTGTWNPDTKTLTWKSAVFGDGLTNTATHRFTDDDTIKWTVRVIDDEGKMYFRVEGTSTRRK
jgi:hypothetical protein